MLQFSNARAIVLFSQPWCNIDVGRTNYCTARKVAADWSGWLYSWLSSEGYYGDPMQRGSLSSPGLMAIRHRRRKQFGFEKRYAP
jgi:hypothetical protein